MRPFATLRGHKLEVWSLALLPDRITLVSGSKDGSVYVWDTTSIQRDRSHFTLTEPVRAWRFSPDSRSILTVDAQGRLGRRQGDDFQSTQPLGEIGSGVKISFFSPDARYLAAGMTDGSLRVWDVTQGKLVREWESDTTRAFPVAFTAGSNHLITLRFGDTTPQEWDLMTGQEVRSWLSSTELGPRSAMAFSPDSKWAFTLDADGSGRLRDLRMDRESILEFDSRQVRQAAFSPDGRFLAVVSALGTGCLWETASANRLAAMHGFLQGMNSVAFSPDGHRIAIGGDGNEAIKLWDVESLQELLTLEGHGSWFNSAAFSGDGRLLASANSKGIVHVWRAPSLDEISKSDVTNR